MKRLLVSGMILLFLSSCSSVEGDVIYPLRAEGLLKTSYNGIKLIAHVSYNDIGQLQLKIVDPVELNGTTLTYSDDTVIVTNNSISLYYDKIFTDSLPLKQIGVALDILNSQKPVFTFTGKELSAELKSDSLWFKVVLDPDSLKIKSIKTLQCLFEFS